MSPQIPLTPLGTARERLIEALGHAPHPTIEVAPALREFNLGEEAAYLAWEITRCVVGLHSEEEKAFFLLVLASIVNLHQGSTRLPVRGHGAAYLGRVFEKLGSPGAAPLAMRLLDDERIAPVLGSPGDYKPLLLEGDFLYHQRTLHFEERLVKALSQRLLAGPFAVPAEQAQRAIDEVIDGRLSAEQQYAVLTALHSPLAVITGGPGTGKTSIVVAILRALSRLGVPMEAVALAAPTGKAANRMKAAIRGNLDALGALGPEDERVAGVPEPRTLHRLLGYAPSSDRFRFHAHNRLPDEVIIVDECSMIDLYLMNQLAHAARDGARLVLLGDAEQLPSVEAGAVFRSLVPQGAGGAAMPWRSLVRPSRRGALPQQAPSRDPRWRAAVRLTHSYRMDASRPEGRNILTVAGRVNAGHAGDLLGDEGEAGEFIAARSSAAAVRFEKVELLDAPRELVAFLDLWLARRVLGLEGFARSVSAPLRQGPEGIDEADVPRLERLFAHHESAKILCVTRADSEGTGADAINAHLHAGLGRALGVVIDDLCPGAVVMMQHNDYDRELFNGDQGVVLKVDAGDGPRPAVVFRRSAGRYGVFRLEAIRSQVQLSFAMTVHKSQGSEFEHVALVLPGENMPLLSREVLYTAITRSKTSVVIVGKRELLEAGTQQPIERFSGVADKLIAATRHLPPVQLG